jgi:hypothetical protein
MYSASEDDVRETYLTLAGWRRRLRPTPWCWYKPPFSGAMYRIQDAYDLQASLDKRRTPQKALATQRKAVQAAIPTANKARKRP